jgi:zinc transport system substrate-binding protein
MILGCLLSFGCGCGEAPDAAGLTVTVSIPPQAYLVERIAGEDVKVLTLVQGGESPATYQPTDHQVSEVMRSSVYFRLGVPFERGRWLDAIKSSGTEMMIVDCREGMTLRRFATSGDGAQTHEHGSDCGH